MENPTRYRITASRRVAAPASRVYDIIADYRDGHPSILPRAFRNSRSTRAGAARARGSTWTCTRSGARTRCEPP